MSKVAVIIVNWNTGKLLSHCLASLQALPEYDLIEKIYVVDNASDDDSLVVAKQAMTDEVKVRFIDLNSNIGFAAGNNRAISLAQKECAKDCHIWLLNPDTEVQPGALKTMISVLDQQTDVGIVGPKLLNTDGTLQPSVRSFPTMVIFTLFFTKLNRLLHNTSLWRRYMNLDFDYNHAQAVDQVMGASFLIRNTAVQNVGLLDEKFWVWFEEVDYCRRAQNKGWVVWYTPEATVVHHGGASFSQLIGWQKTLPWIRSSLHYARKHFNILAWSFLLLLTPVTLALSVPASFAHIVTKQNNLKRL